MWLLLPAYVVCLILLISPESNVIWCFISRCVLTFSCIFTWNPIMAVFLIKVNSQWPRVNQNLHSLSHPISHLQVCFPSWSNAVVKIMVSSSFVPPLIIPPMLTSSRFALHALELPHRRLQLIALRHSSLVSKNVPSWLRWNYCMATRTTYLARDGKSIRFHTLAILDWSTGDPWISAENNPFDFRRACPFARICQFIWFQNHMFTWSLTCKCILVLITYACIYYIQYRVHLHISNVIHVGI